MCANRALSFPLTSEKFPIPPALLSGEMACSDNYMYQASYTVVAVLQT